MFAPRPRIPGQFVTQLKPMWLLQKRLRQRHGPLVSSAALHAHCHGAVCVCVEGGGGEGSEQLTLQTGSWVLPFPVLWDRS